MEESPGRYIVIEPMSSHEAYGIMENFVESLPEGGEKRLLEKALAWKKPFANFKDAVAEMGPLRQEWFSFHDERMVREIKDWLKYNEIDAELCIPTGDRGNE